VLGHEICEREKKVRGDGVRQVEAVSKVGIEGQLRAVGRECGGLVYCCAVIGKRETGAEVNGEWFPPGERLGVNGMLKWAK
jgi:hypothetical protein